jgi:predicted nucleic acid-binding protein
VKVLLDTNAYSALRPIPTNDIWIAAHAMEAGADLISSDPHFGHIDGLPWVAFPAV